MKNLTVSEAMEKDRVERILRELREGHTEEYRRECLISLFLDGRLEPANSLPC